jgi:hypothetical protein
MREPRTEYPAAWDVHDAVIVADRRALSVIRGTREKSEHRGQRAALSGNRGHHPFGTTAVRLARLGGERAFDDGVEQWIGRERGLESVGLERELIVVGKVDERATGALVGMDARDFGDDGGPRAFPSRAARRL